MFKLHISLLKWERFFFDSCIILLGGWWNFFNGVEVVCLIYLAYIVFKSTSRSFFSTVLFFYFFYKLFNGTWNLLFFVENVLTIILLLIPVAAYSLLDRKIMAMVQRRKGPNIIGVWGLLQFLIDGIKLFFKEIIVPSRSNSLFFILSPIFAASLSFTAWFVMPIHPVLCFSNISLDLLLVLTISSLNVYTTVLSGWASNSRYAFLGSLRAVAQIISYELPMFFSLMPIIAYTGSLSIKSIVLAQTNVFFIFPFLPSAIIFLICIIAETNRAPFDLPEAESELVAGYNTEYSALAFALFFISEYASMLLMSALWISLFWGGWLPFFNWLDFIPFVINFSIKLCFISFIYVFIRANLPRYRYDQFMNFGWKVLLPSSFAFFILNVLLFIFFDMLPFLWTSNVFY